jgi:hypothetical protein
MTDNTQQARAASIPDAAIEAAAKASYEIHPATYYLDDSVVTWDALSDSGSGERRKERELIQARAALEAAVPHMRREVLDPELELEIATENYRQWIEGREDVTRG